MWLSNYSQTLLTAAWFLNKIIYVAIFYELTKFYCLVAFTSWDRHSLKSGPETRDPETRDSGTREAGTLELGSWALGVATLGHGTLTRGTLLMEPWDPVASNLPPPQIVLTLFVKQILRGMCVVENVWVRLE